MFRSKIFTTWFIAALCVWAWLFRTYCSIDFLQEYWHYPLIMVLGAFVAGLTPEGGGAVAFPVLSVFFNIDRVLARDFSLMIQSVGMTSASIFILTQPGTDRRVFRPLFWMLPVVCAGFVLGMVTLQSIPVYLIQALFLSMITAFAFSYAWGDHRGTKQSLCLQSNWDVFFIVLILILGGLCASLFGTGADILLYSLLVTRFRLSEKNATRMCIMLMAGTSVFGFGYRHFIDAGLLADQYKTWICAYPVVLFMAPFGAFILSKINVEWMINGIVVLNVAQLAYFNLNRPSVEKLLASLLFMAILLFLFLKSFARLSANLSDASPRPLSPPAPPPLSIFHTPIRTRRPPSASFPRSGRSWPNPSGRDRAFDRQGHQSQDQLNSASAPRSLGDPSQRLHNRTINGGDRFRMSPFSSASIHGLTSRHSHRKESGRIAPP